MNNTRPLISLLLACLLALTQQLGFAHALSHLGKSIPAPSRNDTQHPAEKVCTECALYAQLDAGFTSAITAPIVVAAVYQPISESFRVFDPAFRPPFHSRAPPLPVE